MKNIAKILPVLVLFLVSASMTAEPPDQDNSGCPMHQAADKGFKLLDELHQVMVPAWHEAYPAKNYVALGEAIAKFDAMIPKVKGMAHTFKTIEREEHFNTARNRFVELVGRGKAIKGTANNDALYALFPDLHTRFKEMAYYLLPLDFPEFNSLRIVVDLMIDTHLKNKDYKAIVTSLEALKIKNEMLQKVILPEDLTSVEKKAAADIGEIDNMCRELEAASGGFSTKLIDDYLGKLKILCDKFEQNYI